MSDIYQKLLEFTHNGVYRYTFHDGRVLMANQGFISILDLKCKPSDIIGRKLKDLMIYTQEEGSIRRELEATGEIHGMEYHFRTLSGFEKWVTHDSFKSTDPETGEDIVDAIVEDITTRKKSMEALSRLFAAVNAAAESIIITDSKGIIQYVNPCFEHMTGYSSREILGQNTNILKSGKHDRNFYTELWNSISKGNVWRGHFTNRKKDGTLFEEDAVISPVLNEAGNVSYYVAVKRDVTQEVALEKQLLQSQKMEAIGRLAGGIAHDFTNMLTVILQHARLAKKKIPEASDLNMHLNEIIDAGERVATLTSQLLSFSNRQTISLRVMDVNRAVHGVEEMLKRTVGEDIHVTLRTTSDPIYAKVDPALIEQVIIHMAVNSKDSMPNGGQLTVETSRIKLSEAETVQIQNDHSGENVQAGNFALLSISDSGCGMSEETISRIFEPFFTTKGLGKSTGLGLSTVYGIVKRHGGHINVYSNVGCGTTFTILLPVAPPPQNAETTEMDGSERIQGGIETILIAEDNPIVRKVLVGIVKKLGYSIMEADCGLHALDMLSESRMPIHLMLTDIIMPEMDGKTLAGRVRKLRPDIKILFASGYPRTHLTEYGVLKENDILISKPFCESAVARAIRDTLDRPSEG